MSLFRNRYHELRGWVVAALGVLFLTAVIGSAVAITYTVDAKSCRVKANAMEREWEHSLFSGCLVQAQDGTFVPLDIYRLTQAEL
jgi:hypothetical protein